MHVYLNHFSVLIMIKVVITGATAPQSKWDEVGVKLRPAAISMTVL